MHSHLCAGSVSLVQLLRCLAPVFSAAWAYQLLGERLQLVPLLGLLTTLLGTALASWKVGSPGAKGRRAAQATLLLTKHASALSTALITHPPTNPSLPIVHSTALAPSLHLFPPSPTHTHPHTYP